MRPRNLLALLLAALLTPSLAAAPAAAIHSIQGNGSRSALAGQAVTTTGIVTAIRASSSSGGFYIQDEDNAADSDPQTSEGILVFTGSAAMPAAVALGNLVTVTGTVQEYVPSSDSNSPSLTEIVSPAVTLVATGKPLPAPVTIDGSVLTPDGGIEQLERFEGMRVNVASLLTIAPTGGFVTEKEATATSDGVFWGVLNGTPRPFREPGIQLPDALPSGAPSSVPRYDANPEKLRVDSDALRGTSPLNVTPGQLVAGITGVLDYASRAYTLLPESSISASGTPMAVRPVRTALPDELTVASFNMERFFDTTDDTGMSDVALSATAFANRLAKASLAIRDVLRMPDVLGVEEVENLTTLQAIASRVNADAAATGSGDPQYVAYLQEGNDIGGIDVGFLVRSSRVAVTDVVQEEKDATFLNPATQQQDILHDRPPLVLRATLRSPAYRFTVIVNHLRSLNDIDSPTSGARVRAKRAAEAEHLAGIVQARQRADPNDHIFLVGDFNSFQFSDGYVDAIGTIKGTPAPADSVVLSTRDLVDPDLIDLVDSVPAGDRYSYSYLGDAQVLDHILVTRNVIATLEFARSNADFPEVYRSDPSRSERLSDHDVPVAYVTTRAAVTGAPRRRVVRP